MSKLDKDQVLADFTAAYEKANGKKPDIAENNGWFSVDGGKNVRLAQLAEQASELTGGQSSGSKPAKKASTASKKAATSDKKASKKPATKKATTQSKSSGGGLSAKELWQQRLRETKGDSRLPRGMQ